MTVFGVLNFGDQGNTACENLCACFNLSNTFFFHLFSTFYYYSIHDKKYQSYKIYCCQSKEDNLASAILTNKKINKMHL